MVEKTYAYHKPSTESLERIKQLRHACSALHHTFMELGTQGRELAVAYTNLEQAAMWAIKSVVCNDPASVVEE